MAGPVPDGRSASRSASKTSWYTNGNGTHSSSPLSINEKESSKSLSRVDDDSNQHDKSTDLNISLTLDRKRSSKVHKPKLSKSISSFFNKFTRMTNVSLQTQSTTVGGTFKKRSRSIDKADRASSDGTSSGSSSPQCTELYVKKLISENGKPPGVSGIVNHGNTCFMNSVLQCLSNTVQFVEYFLADQYKDDLKRHKNTVAKRNGSKGELTEALAWLLKSLWTYKYSASASRDLKGVIGKHSLQYVGCSQHDAQEFFLWLIDNVHEELRVESKKPPLKKKEAGEEESAPPPDRGTVNAESRIYELFQATYRSSLTCSSCRHQSHTYDPFFCLSLPIPQSSLISVTVVVVYLNEQPRQVRVAVKMSAGDTVRHLLAKVSRSGQVPDGQLMLIQTYPNGLARTCLYTESLVDVLAATGSDSLCALELPPVDTKTGNDTVTLIVTNVDAINHQERLRFGGYFVVRLPKNVTFKDLQKSILHKMVTSVVDCDVPSDKAEVPFKLRLASVERDDGVLSADMPMPLYSAVVNQMAKQYATLGCPAHAKVLVEWPQGSRQRLLPNFADLVEDHESVRTTLGQTGDLFALDECFQLYTQEEQLVGDNAWLCPKCKNRQCGAVKSISLWSLPPVLVVHLKRFRQAGSLRTKVNTLVTFPVKGLNMRRYMVDSDSSSGTSNGKVNGKVAASDEWTYDLYGVCNHYGNMLGGHYTAMCCNPLDGQWYTFDDNQVTLVAESQIMSRSAYLLFYQKRSTSSSGPAPLPHALVDTLCRTHGLANNGQGVANSQSPQGMQQPARMFLRNSTSYGTMAGTVRRRSNTAPNSGANTPSRAPAMSLLPHASSADPLPIGADSLVPNGVSNGHNTSFARRYVGAANNKTLRTMSPPTVFLPYANGTITSFDMPNSGQRYAPSDVTESLVKTVEGSSKRQPSSGGGTASTTLVTSSAIGRSKTGLPMTAEQAEAKKTFTLQESCV